MLDNFSVSDTKKAVDIIAHRYETESSGGITYDTIRDYAEQGVDFISVGALTHSVKGLDMSFKAASKQEQSQALSSAEREQVRLEGKAC